MKPTHFAISGAILLGYWAIGLFFFRFQRKSGDRFFGFFGCAFWLLTFERALLIWVFPDQEEKSYVYAVRLIAFLFILYAIIDKNRSTAGLLGQEPSKEKEKPD
jgi:hypothetical protein